MDLSEATSAFFKFYAKWDIENDWDYVQFSVSSNGGEDYTPICGNYSNPTSGNQLGGDGSPVYDGMQADWVQEIICLDDYLGESELFVKFTFFSDEYVTGDGFYFDDISYEAVIDGSLSVFDLDEVSIQLRPNPTDDFLNLNIDQWHFRNDLTYEIYNAIGKKIMGQAFDRPQLKLDVSTFENGVYFLKVMDGNKQLAGTKFIKN